MKITSQQLASLNTKMRDRRQNECLLQMVAAWRMLAPGWKENFVLEMDAAKIRSLFTELLLWSDGVGIEDHSQLLTTALLVLRAMHEGISGAKINHALALIANAGEGREIMINSVETLFFHQEG